MGLPSLLNHVIMIKPYSQWMFLFLLAGCVCLSISLHLKHHLHRAMVFHMSSIKVQVDCNTSPGHDCLHLGHCHPDVYPRFSCH